MEGFLFGAACADNSKSFATYLPFFRTPQFLNLSFPYGILLERFFWLPIFPIPPYICGHTLLPKKSLLFPHFPSFIEKKSPVLRRGIFIKNVFLLCAISPGK